MEALAVIKTNGLTAAIEVGDMRVAKARQMRNLVFIHVISSLRNKPGEILLCQKAI